MFDWYEPIREYYKLGFYTAEQVGIFAAAGWITPEQAARILKEA